jgi:hypothetical protein
VAGYDWEYPNVNTNDNAPSIRVAACRPASFLNWVRNGATAGSVGIWGGNGGMCAQGDSAGSGAIAYALAWYNAGAATASFGQGYLDKVVLKSGPVFSDIEQGCEIQGGVNSQYTSICASGSTQTGCTGWTPQPSYHLEYLQNAQDSVNSWSGNTTPAACANNRPNGTTTYNTNWLQMSIVDFTETQQPSFSYTNTAMSAWLCETTAIGIAPNNSAPEGQLFYEQFTNQSQAGGFLSVNAITGCPNNPENVDAGFVAGTQETGMAAIENDMITAPTSCAPRHN